MVNYFIYSDWMKNGDISGLISMVNPFKGKNSPIFTGYLSIILNCEPSSVREYQEEVCFDGQIRDDMTTEKNNSNERLPLTLNTNTPTSEGHHQPTLNTNTEH
jgi:hypothetical protein